MEACILMAAASCSAEVESPADASKSSSTGASSTGATSTGATSTGTSSTGAGSSVFTFSSCVFFFSTFLACIKCIKRAV